MQAIVAQTKAAKQDAKHTQAQLDASTEQLDKKGQEIMSLRVRSYHLSTAQPILLQFPYSRCLYM